jgi:hypothetical protein
MLDFLQWLLDPKMAESEKHPRHYTVVAFKQNALN